MKVNAIDHVNIIVADLDATATFYAEVLGLDRRNGPPPLGPGPQPPSRIPPRR